MFEVADVIAVNTSNSRTVSILKTYAEEPLVINLEKTGPTSNTIQTPGRFRLQPTRVVNIYEVEDINEDTLEVESIRVANSIYRLSPNQHSYMKDNSRYAGIYKYVKEFDKRIMNSVKNAVGKALSVTTRLRRAALQKYLSTTDLTEVDYNHYISIVSKDHLYKKSMFYLHLDTFKRIGALSWNAEARVKIDPSKLNFIARLTADISFETRDVSNFADVAGAIIGSVDTMLADESAEVKESVVAAIVESSGNAITDFRIPAYLVNYGEDVEEGYFEDEPVYPEEECA